jgi:hypothetical protein
VNCSEACADASTEILNDPDITFRGKEPGVYPGDLGAQNGQMITDRSDPMGQAAQISGNFTVEDGRAENVEGAVPPIGREPND